LKIAESGTYSVDKVFLTKGVLWVRGWVLRWIINGFGLLVTARIIEGFEVGGIFSALVAAAVLGIVNAIIRPVVLVLTLPINILTLGLFTLVINGVMLALTASVVKGFAISGFLPAVGGALLLTIISGVLSALVED
jgi:putative membrane protein